MGGYERDMQDLTLEQAVARNKIIAKYEADCKKLREDPSLLDRLAAENAELRKRLDWAKQIVKAQEATSNGTACAKERAAGNGGCGACAWCCSAANATLDEERAAYAVLLESHEIILDALTESDAALDALREAVQSDEWIYAKHTDTDGQMERIEDILYPQPKETTDDE